MVRDIVDTVTPQAKMIRTSEKFGNVGIIKQQGTSRVIYDTLPHDGRLDYRFFEGVGTRLFPFTNLTENKLSVGEVMVIERAYIMFFTFIAGVPSLIDNVNAQPDFLGATLEFTQANMIIIKPVPISSFSSEFNKDAYHDNYTNFEMDTQLVLEPLLEFQALVRMPSSVTVANQQVRLVIAGAGAILSPRNTF